MFSIIPTLLDRLRGVHPRLRSWCVYLATGRKFRKFGKHSKLIGAAAIALGNGVCVGDFCWIEAVTRYKEQRFTPRFSIGHRVALSDLTHISCAHRILIGDDCLLGSKIYIGDHSHGAIGNTFELLHVPPAMRPLSDFAEIVIGEKTWICDGAVILAGSHIAPSSIVAANSVVRLSESRPALIAGVPARVIRYLDGNDDPDA